MSINSFTFNKYQLIEICNDSPTGETHLTVDSRIDREGNYQSDIPPITVKLDNHQMYLLAIAMLQQVETIDTRGTN